MLVVAGRYGGPDITLKHAWGERAIAGLLACVLHAGLASLMWCYQPARGIHESLDTQPMFVEIFPQTHAPELDAQVTHSGEPIDINGTSLKRDLSVGDISVKAPASETQSHKKTARPLRPQVERLRVGPPSEHAPKSGEARPFNDYAWRPSDSHEPNEQRERGAPAYRLSSKASVERSALARELEKAARPPCRDVHASKGLLAIPFLLADSVTDSGCKW